MNKANRDDFKPVSQMPMVWKLTAAVTAWLLFIAFMHEYVNSEASDRKVITMGYMPVFSNLAAPILDYVSKDSKGVRFKALKFASFAEMGESLRNNQIDAAFIIAPLSVVLHQQGEDVKIILNGNRRESTLVVRKELNAKTWNNLIGKTIAVPMRYSGHNLSIMEQMEKHNLTGQINIVEMNPPDMASALAAGSLDGYYVGEPFAAKTVKAGQATVFAYSNDLWAGFFSNLTIVKGSLIQKEPETIKYMVTAAARALQWAKLNQEEAGRIASKYWGQPYDLVMYTMNTPKNRINFDEFAPKQEDIQKIADLMQHFGLSKTNDISGLVEDSYAKDADISHISGIESILPR